MSVENVKAFMDKLATDKDLQDKFQEAEKNYSGDKNDRVKVFNEVFVPAAKSAGITLTVEDFKAYEDEAAKLPESEIKAVSGGGDSLEICGNHGGIKSPIPGCQYVAQMICILNGEK